jgi:hypothetical protein
MLLISLCILLFVTCTLGKRKESEVQLCHTLPNGKILEKMKQPPKKELDSGNYFEPYDFPNPVNPANSLTSCDPCSDYSAILCLNGGTCTNTNNAEEPYNCACPLPYTGPNCATNVCNPNPCKNGGDCNPVTDQQSTFTCDCPAEYTGPTCEVPVSDCSPACTPVEECVLETCVGSGELYFRITWSSTAVLAKDLDLLVVTPTGKMGWYFPDDPEDTDFGIFDGDNLGPAGPENFYYTSDHPPTPGDYIICVNYNSLEDTALVHLTFGAHPNIHTIDYEITPDDFVQPENSEVQAPFTGCSEDTPNYVYTYTFPG